MVFSCRGPIGTGKSYIAGCIANALLNQEITVKMTNFNTIIDDTTNLSIKQLKKKRIYDCILEMCVPLYVGGFSYRSDIAHEKMGK